MFFIYTKERKSELAFTVNLTADEVTQFMDGNLFLDYPELTPSEHIVIERTEPFKYPTYDEATNTIREMTRDELIEEGIEVQLNQGEYIENKKLIIVPQPTSYHTWNINTHEWDIDMSGVKKTFKHKFQAILLEKLFGSFEYKGKVFQMRDYDEINFIRVKIALDIASETTDIEILKEALHDLEITVTPDLEEKLKNVMKSGKLKEFLKSLNTKWRLQDNSVADISLGDINQVYLKWILKVITAQNKYTAIFIEIEKAKTVEDLEKIEWN
ncbi:MAG: hypothetical protein HXM12_07605 [Fusobacterium periodonticum]|nr:hypothetical protein [Fusobacterium periodonticum]